MAKIRYVDATTPGVAADGEGFFGTQSSTPLGRFRS
jgi:hypothetical protein